MTLNFSFMNTFSFVRNQRIGITLTFLSVTMNCFSQINSHQLNTNLTAIQKKSNLPGFAVGIIKNDSVIFSEGFGFADKKKRLPYTPETIQPIASVSKTFIGLALMKAVDLGYFTLETDINEILPFKITNPNYPKDKIKIKDLATHTSGLIDNDTTYIKAYCLGTKPSMELKTFLENYYSEGGKYYSKANFGNSEAGKEYKYSNIASSLAAYLIEIKAGIPFYEFTDKYIFNPMKMSNTSWFYNEKDGSNYALLYEVNKQSLPIYKELLNKDKSLKSYSCITYPDGSLKSSVSDLLKYLRIMIKGYSNNSDLLTTESFKKLFEKQYNDNNMPADMSPAEPNRAIFWAYNRKGKLSHNGSDPGVTSFISFDPNTRIGKVLLINTQIEGDDNIRTVEFCKQIIMEIENFEKGL